MTKQTKTDQEVGPRTCASFIQTNNQRWRDFLAVTPHDFYHLPEYVALEADQECGEATAFYAERDGAKLLVPLILRDLPEQFDTPVAWRDAMNPYGYPCPLFLADPKSDSSEEEQFEILWRSFFVTAKAQNIVSVFLRMHPLLPLPSAPLERMGQLVQHGQTVYLDLANSEEMLAGICRNHRRSIKKLAAAGFQITIDDWSYYPRFIEIYRATMKRLHADSKYYFEGDYFSCLRRVLGDDLHLAIVTAPSGEVAAGEIFTTTCGIVQNHLAGTNEKYQPLSPTKILTDHMRCWAQEHGEKLFHMGGGLGGREDSLFRFKAGFSKLRADFYTYRMIPDDAKYQQCVTRRDKVGENEEKDQDFFPAYRRSLPH